MPGNFGYSSNRNVRTRSNGRRARHGYNYRHLIQYCAALNRESEHAPIHEESMFETVAQAFAQSRRRNSSFARTRKSR